MLSVHNAMGNNKDRVRMINPSPLNQEESQSSSLMAYCLLFNNLIFYLSNKFTDKALEVNSKFSKLTGYKVSIKSIHTHTHIQYKDGH